MMHALCSYPLLSCGPFVCVRLWFAGYGVGGVEVYVQATSSVGLASDCSVVVVRSMIRNNQAAISGYAGMGVWLTSQGAANRNSSVVVDDCSIVDNTPTTSAAADDGGVYIEVSATAIGEGAGSHDGAVEDVSIVVRRSQFVGNAACTCVGVPSVCV